MNRINKPSAARLAALAAVLALTACGAAVSPQQEPPLAGAAIVWHSRFTADMSFFLPARPTAEQQVLVSTPPCAFSRW